MQFLASRENGLGIRWRWSCGKAAFLLCLIEGVVNMFFLYYPELIKIARDFGFKEILVEGM